MPNAAGGMQPCASSDHRAEQRVPRSRVARRRSSAGSPAAASVRSAFDASTRRCPLSRFAPGSAIVLLFRASRTTRPGSRPRPRRGIAPVTTEPAPITESEPIVAPLRIRTPIPTKTLSPISTGAVFWVPPCGGPGRGRGSRCRRSRRGPRSARRGRSGCRPLALQHQVVVELGPVADLDRARLGGPRHGSSRCRTAASACQPNCTPLAER